MSAPEATVKVDTLHIYPGQTVTLYLHPKPSHYRADGENPGRQVEARVLEDGTAQVFAETDALSFERWTTQDTESARLAAEGWSWEDINIETSRRRNASLQNKVDSLTESNTAKDKRIAELERHAEVMKNTIATMSAELAAAREEKTTP